MPAIRLHLRPRLLSVVVIVSLLAGCGGGGATTPSTSPGDSMQPSAGATSDQAPVGSLAPPSPEATDARLRRALAAGSPWQATATFDGDIGDAATISGTVAVRGNDASMTFVRTYPDDSRVTVREVVVGGWSYVKYEDQAWQLVPQDSAHPRPASFRTALMTADCAESQPGRLAMAGDDAITIAEALGMVDPGTSGIGAEATVTLRPDGNPDRLELGFDSDVGRWAVAYAFDASPTVDPISAPEDVVATWQQSGAFLLLYPQDWEVDSIGQAPEIMDIFMSPDGLMTVWCEPADLSLEEWTADGVRHYSEYWSTKPTESWTETYGSNTWNFTDFATATANGDSGTAVVAATVHGGLGCDLSAYVVSSGNRETLLGQFARVVASFTFLN